VIGSAGSSESFVEWYVSTNALLKQPLWDGFSTEIPLSAKKACDLALPRVRDQVPQVRAWGVEHIFLRNLFSGGASGHMYSYPNVWCYQITFMPSDPVERESIKKQPTGYAMTQIVLLDGTVVPPTVIRNQ
jgi:hypothetical protein